VFSLLLPGAGRTILEDGSISLSRRRHLANFVKQQRSTVGKVQSNGCAAPRPVNAPRSWPKIHFSISVSEGEQLMAYKRSAGSGESLWIVRATISLPDPVSR